MVRVDERLVEVEHQHLPPNQTFKIQRETYYFEVKIKGNVRFAINVIGSATRLYYCYIASLRHTTHNNNKFSSLPPLGKAMNKCDWVIDCLSFMSQSQPILHTRTFTFHTVYLIDQALAYVTRFNQFRCRTAAVLTLRALQKQKRNCS